MTNEEIFALKAKTTDDANTKAGELTKREGVKVHPMVFSMNNGEKWIVGFIKEPMRIVKARAMDKTYLGMGFSMGEEILRSCLLTQDSDPAILSEDPEYDEVNLGACKFAGELVKMSINQSEKKN